MVKRLIRVSGFVSKEIREVVRQPRLIASLLFGPFLILILFGLGYVGDLGKLRAILVVPNDPAYTSKQSDLREQFGKGPLNLIDLTTDLEGAKGRLARGETDLVIEVPADAAQQIGAGAQAIIPVYYNEVDPLGEARIVGGTLNYTAELNRDTVAAAFKRGQNQAGDVKLALDNLDAALGRVSTNLADNNVTGAAQQAAEARRSTDAILLGAGLLIQIAQAAPLPGSPITSTQNLAKTEDSVRTLNSDVAALQQELATPSPDPTRTRERVEKVRTDVRDLRALTGQFQQINPYVLVAPFFGRSVNLAPAGAATFLNYYTPGVIILLLQHIAITLAALSMVRERMRGAIEIFRVAPITPGEILLGKYLGFTLFLGVLAAALVAVAVVHVVVGGGSYSVLGIPMLGDWGWLALTVGLVIVSSLALGFALSMISKSESQAVQLAMLALLTSVFFGGFFLPLKSFWWPVRDAALALPVTPGIVSLQDIMLRGRAPDPYYLLVLVAQIVGFGAFAYWRFGREFRRG